MCSKRLDGIPKVIHTCMIKHDFPLRSSSVPYFVKDHNLMAIKIIYQFPAEVFKYTYFLNAWQSPSFIRDVANYS